MVCIQEQQALVGGAPRGPAEFTLVKIERFGQNINRGQRHRRVACYTSSPHLSDKFGKKANLTKRLTEVYHPEKHAARQAEYHGRLHELCRGPSRNLVRINGVC